MYSTGLLLNHLLVLVRSSVLFLLTFSCSSPSEESKHENKAPISNLNEVISERFEIEDKVTAYINDDQLKDEVYVVKMSQSGHRWLYVCFGLEDDYFELITRSPSALQNFDTLSMIEDPYVELEVGKNAIKIVHLENQSYSCKRVDSFYFDASKREFYLSGTAYSNYYDEQSKRWIDSLSTDVPRGHISLSTFDIKKKYTY